MPNKKINALDVRVAVGTDLMLVGDPTTGTAYKSTLNTLPLVPYSGATGAVNLGAYDMTVNGLTIGKGANSIASNTAIGIQTLSSITSGSLNTGVGQWALLNSTTAQRNTAIGYSALDRNTTGNQNTSVGMFALYENTTGLNNVGIGYNAGRGITTGNYNTIIGTIVGLPTTTSNNIILADGQGNIRFRDDATNTILSRLAGVGTRMVVTDTNGALSTQAIPSVSGFVPYTGATSDLNIGAYNFTANNVFTGFSTITASGTQVVLTITSVPEIQVTGSGGQTIKLPDATTLANGTTYRFNNNQSSGAILVNNNSNTLVASVPSGAYVDILLLSNSIAAGSWDRHDLAPANVSWSTNTFDYPGSITSATWNGNAVAVNRGGTGATTSSGALTNLGAQAALTLTTTGTSGAATLVGATLNIPQYSGGGGMAIGGSITSATAGSVLFAGASGVLAQNNANFFWDNTNARLGIGTNAPTTSLEINYSNNAYSPGLLIKNTNTGTNSLTGISLYSSDNSEKGVFQYIPANFSSVILRNTVIFGSSSLQKLAFIANAGASSSSVGKQDIYFSSNGQNTNIYLYGTTGNLVVQNGGTFTDAGYRLDVNGTARVSGVLNVASSTNYTGVLVNGNNAPRVIFATGTNTSGISMGLSGLDSSTFTINDVFNFKGGFISMGSDLPVTGTIFRMTTNIAGTSTAFGINISSIVQSNVTTAANIYSSNTGTPNFAFTLSNLRHFYASPQTKGAASTITNQSGFFADSNLIDATNNYGFYGNIPNAANRWNLYMGGTADNYLAGNLGIGTTSVTNWLNIAAGTTAKAQINLASSTAPTSPNDGDIWFDGTNLKIRIGGVTRTFTII